MCLICLALATTGVCASTLDPSDARREALSLHHVGTTYFQKGEFDAAIFVLQDAVKLVPAETGPRANLGAALEARGFPADVEAALAEFSLACTFAPGMAVLQQALNRTDQKYRAFCDLRDEEAALAKARARLQKIGFQEGRWMPLVERVRGLGRLSQADALLRHIAVTSDLSNYIDRAPWLELAEMHEKHVGDHVAADDILSSLAKNLPSGISGDVYWLWATHMPLVFNSPATEEEAHVITDVHYEATQEMNTVLQRAIDRLQYVERLADANLTSSPAFYTSGFLLFTAAYMGLITYPLHQAAERVLQKISPQLQFTAPHAQLGPRFNENAQNSFHARVHVAFISPHCFSATPHPTLKRHLHMINAAPSEFEVTLACWELPENCVDHASGHIAPYLHRVNQVLGLSHDLGSARETLAALKADVVVFTETGLSWNQYFLALGRYAPVQVKTGGGHPESSGLSTIDYYLSELPFESEVPGERQRWYSEQLVMTRELWPTDLSVYGVMPGRNENDDLLSRDAVLELLRLSPTDQPVYVFAKQAQKLSPITDWMVRRILEKDLAGRVVILPGFKDNPGLISIYRSRLFLVLGPGLMSRVSLLSTQLARRQWRSVLWHADALLEAFPYTGFTTTMEAFLLNQPLVTLPHPTSFSGIQTTALLKLMNLSDFIARDVHDYAEIATRLANDKSFQVEMRARTRKAVLELYAPENGNSGGDVWRFFGDVGRGRPPRVDAEGVLL